MSKDTRERIERDVEQRKHDITEAIYALGLPVALARDARRALESSKTAQLAILGLVEEEESR